MPAKPETISTPYYPWMKEHPARSIVRTMRAALEARGIDPASIVEGGAALDWEVADCGADISPEPLPIAHPKMVLSFTRIGRTGRNKREPYRQNSGVALSPCHTRILWIG